MKDKGLIVVAVFLIAVVALSGCVDCKTDKDCESGQTCTDGKCVSSNEGLDVYVGGSQGVEGKFIYPTELYEGQGFGITMGFENKGETEIAGGDLKVYLGNVNWETYGVNKDETAEIDKYHCKSKDTWPQEIRSADGKLVKACPSNDYGFCHKGETYFQCCASADYTDCKDEVERKMDSIGTYLPNSGLLYDSAEDALDAVTKSPSGNAVDGGYTELDFGTSSNELTVNDPAGLPVTFVATMCYPYKTEAVAQVCTGKPEYGEEGVCDPNPEKLDIDSSGAPIKITKIEERSSGKKNIFRIYFENVGTGQPYVKELDGTDDSNCVTSLTAPDKGKVNVESIMLGTTTISGLNGDCEVTESAKSLANGVITCQYDNGGSSLAQQTLKVTLKYNYKDKIQHTMQIIGV